ncbi:glycosyltransferase family 2 protein [Thiolinea disciformis]|uniref:glycosyltransferase family 2 protein n=1 Tax=Thiolinea disciformis TaxID=125614 RepID=UPI00036CDD54|nr:glycosyltransferase family 2 protein [Thiolinea disciformis]
MSRPEQFTLSCVIPAYNEAENLESFIEALHASLKNTIPNFLFIIVNDGSSDHTDQTIKNIMNKYPIHYLNFSRNFGKEAALSAGIDQAQSDVTLLIDSDFQHPVELIAQMLDLWKSGYDMIYGVIADRRHETWIKRYGTNSFYRLINANRHNHFQIPANAGDFRLMDKAVVETLKRLPERRRFMKGLYAWVGYKTIAIPFVPAERAAGTSSFNLRTLLSLASTGITSFSSIPLRLSGFLGSIISICSVIYAAYIASDTLIFGNPVPGWSTLAAGLALFSGVQLLMLGIIGEYISQIYEEVKQRPLYVIAEQQISPQLSKIEGKFHVAP